MINLSYLYLIDTHVLSRVDSRCLFLPSSLPYSGGLPFARLGDGARVGLWSV